jgi:hypothetical protein
MPIWAIAAETEWPSWISWTTVFSTGLRGRGTGWGAFLGFAALAVVVRLVDGLDFGFDLAFALVAGRAAAISTSLSAAHFMG